MKAFLTEIQLLYSVNPYIFLLIYAVSIPLYWYTVFRIVKAVKSKNGRQSLNWIIANIAVFIAPYTYLYIVGRDFPLLLHFLVGFIVIFAFFSLKRKIKRIER